MAKGKEKILICDDDKTVRRLIRKALENEGYRCFEASNGQEAMESMERVAFDLLFLDTRLPDISGLDLLRDIRRCRPDTLVIIVTATGEQNVALLCIRQGAYDYITKPVNLDELLSRAKRASETISLRQQVIDYQRHLEKKIEEQSEEIRRTSLGAMAALSFALESKDRYTAGHSRRVADIAVAIGKKIGLREDELRDLRWGSLLHDLAKLAVDETVAHKEGRLTPQEYEHIMAHPVVGACIAGSIVRNKGIIEVIQHHHAHFDGQGSRQTLAKEEIPLLARIVAVADAYDAMTSNRSYRDALSREEALDIIAEETGEQFDPNIAQVFRGMSEADILPERKKILIADDEESIRLLVKSILGNDYTLIEACNGQEAVRAAINEKPDLVFMDVLMQEKDGILACSEIKNNPETKDIPVIMMSGIDSQSNRFLAATSGSSGYIDKPFTPQDLMNAVQKFTGRQ
jgi:putative two-component system response regulator